MTTMPGPRWMLASLLLLCALAVEQDQGTKFNFAELAKSALARGGTQPGALKGFDDYLGGDRFGRIEIASFDLLFPVDALKDPRWGKALREGAVTLLDLERNWHVWRNPALADDPAWNADWTTVKKWIQSWPSPALTHLKGGPVSLLDQLGANDKVRAAAKKIRDIEQVDEETTQVFGRRNRILLGPGRKDFLELVAVAGYLQKDQQAAMWSRASLEGAIAWSGWLQILCLENAKSPFDASQPFLGTSMVEHDATGHEQFFADRAAAILLRKQFWRHGTLFLESTLGTNLVIATVGKDDLYAGIWKQEYRTTGETTQPYQRFVPGGNPAGGTLPARKAGPGNFSSISTEVSLYRSDLGENFFLKSLKEGQKDGKKLASKDPSHKQSDDPLSHFEIRSFEPPAKYAVTAPFLGPVAEDKALPPSDFLDDYEDCFRAYRSCFLHWLQDHGGGDAQKSMVKFGQLIARQASLEDPQPLAAIIEQIYGVPLSAPSASTDSLEWRFLGFLAGS